MYIQSTVWVFLACNSLGVRIWEIILSFLLLFFGGWFLNRSRTGKINAVRVFGHNVIGEDAKLASTVFAIILLFLGVLIFLAAVLKLDC